MRTKQQIEERIKLLHNKSKRAYHEGNDIINCFIFQSLIRELEWCLEEAGSK